MIGGMDIQFPVWSGPIALDFAARLVAGWWPDCVFVADNDANVIASHRQLQFHECSELIVYRTAAACDLWDELGYDESLKGTMIYLISTPTHLTLITEHDPLPEIAAITAAIRDGLRSASPFPSQRLQEAA